MTSESTWPLWRRSGTDEVPSLTDYAELARYVSADALLQFDHREPPTDLPGQKLVERLYDELARLRIGHIEESSRSAPVRSGGPQQIRAPRDVQRYGAATTLDACVAFAAIAHRAGLGPVLALGNHVARKEWHAIVLIALDSDDSVGADTSLAGVLTADELTSARIETDSLVAIDVVAALTSARAPEPEPIVVAVARGREFVRSMIGWGEPLVLVNVRARQRTAEFRPYAPGIDTTFLPMSLPPRAGRLTLFSSQHRAVEELRGRSGVVALIGPSGSGKTTAALQLAIDHVEGAAWFLNASSPDSLVGSLAEIFCREQGKSANRVDRADREGYAAALLARANASSSPWCVVLDNADGAPSSIMRAIPRPSHKREQLVIVTTTNAAWLEVPQVTAHVWLERINDSDTARILGKHPRLAQLVDGRAVTLQAYARYIQTTGSAAGLERHADDADVEDEELRGVVALIRAVLDDRPEMQAELGRLSLLPADHLPSGRNDSYLADHGLIELDVISETGRMHRLIGRAVRYVLGEFGLSNIALTIVKDDDARGALSLAAGPELLDRIEQLLLTESPEGNGLELAAAASLMELRGRIESSRRLAERAKTALEGPDESLPVEFADVLQCLARYVNQHQRGDSNAIDVALDYMMRAQTVAKARHDSERWNRARRLHALLRVKRAKLAATQSERVVGIDEALVELEAAASEAASGDRPAETARALFNVAGPHVELAQMLPSEAGPHFDRAFGIYQRVREARTKMYGEPLHPHIAACISGQALVRYLQAVMVEASFGQRQALLAEATQLEAKALNDRFELEGPLGGADTGKSARLLTKIAYARHVLNQQHAPTDVLAEAARENILPRLTAKTDPWAFIARWAGSPALAALINHPSFSDPEAALRAAADMAPYSAPDAAGSRTVLVSARLLGLIDTELPERRVFDHALVVGLSAETLRETFAVLTGHLTAGRLAAERVTVLAPMAALDGAPADVEVVTPAHEDRSELESVIRIEPERLADGDRVLLIIRHVERLRGLALLRRWLPAQHVDALGINTRRPTAADYGHEIGATAGVLEQWWAAR